MDMKGSTSLIRTITCLCSRAVHALAIRTRRALMVLCWAVVVSYLSIHAHFELLQQCNEHPKIDTSTQTNSTHQVKQDKHIRAEDFWYRDSAKNIQYSDQRG